jgi:hypothetical protein
MGDDCELLAGKRIEQRRFAGVGPADDGNESGVERLALTLSYFHGQSEDLAGGVRVQAAKLRFAIAERGAP